MQILHEFLSRISFQEEKIDIELCSTLTGEFNLNFNYEKNTDYNTILTWILSCLKDNHLDQLISKLFHSLYLHRNEWNLLCFKTISLHVISLIRDQHLTDSLKHIYLFLSHIFRDLIIAHGVNKQHESLVKEIFALFCLHSIKNLMQNEEWIQKPHSNEEIDKPKAMMLEKFLFLLQNRLFTLSNPFVRQLVAGLQNLVHSEDDFVESLHDDNSNQTILQVVYDVHQEIQSSVTMADSVDILDQFFFGSVDCEGVDIHHQHSYSTMTYALEFLRLWGITNTSNICGQLSLKNLLLSRLFIGNLLYYSERRMDLFIHYLDRLTQTCETRSLVQIMENFNNGVCANFLILSTFFNQEGTNNQRFTELEKLRKEMLRTMSCSSSKIKFEQPCYIVPDSSSVCLSFSNIFSYEKISDQRLFLIYVEDFIKMFPYIWESKNNIVYSTGNIVFWDIFRSLCWKLTNSTESKIVWKKLLRQMWLVYIHLSLNNWRDRKNIVNTREINGVSWILLLNIPSLDIFWKNNSDLFYLVIRKVVKKYNRYKHLNECETSTVNEKKISLFYQSIQQFLIEIPVSVLLVEKKQVLGLLENICNAPFLKEIVEIRTQRVSKMIINQLEY